MKHFLVLIILCNIILFSGVTMAENEPLEQNLQFITAVAFEGNKRVSDEEIRSLISTEAGELLDEEKLKNDMQKLYDTGYFQDVKISFEVYNAGLKAIFELSEYPIVKDIIIKGNESYSDQELMKELKLVKGEILNHNAILESRKAIERLYQEAGYVLAVFKDIDIDDNGVVTFEINEGYLNELIIEGNEKTKDFVIRREFDIKKGDVINVKELQEYFRQLIRLNYFEDINPKLERVDFEKNTANVILEVTEGRTGRFNFGVSYSTAEGEGWGGFITVQERNLFGNGQTLGFDWEFGGTTNYEINFYEPWVFGTPTSFGIGLYDKSYSSEDSVKGDYDVDKSGGSISLGHPLSEEWNGRIKFKVEKSNLDWEDRIYTEDGKTYENTDEDTDLRSITLQTSRDTTNHPFNPTSGGIDVLSLEYAGRFLGGDADFVKYRTDFRRFYNGFKGNQAWALRLETGFSDGDLPELEKYRLGGSETIRGYDKGSFTGDDMLLMNLEYRIPITENFTGVLFVDGGNTWDSYRDIQFDDLHYSTGLGIRMDTFLGQIRLDYGFNEDGEGQPHFSIGNTF